MKTSKVASFTLKPSTIEKLNEYSKIKSINKSSLIDKLINEEILREVEKYLWEQENTIPVDILAFIKKYIKIETKSY